MMTAKSQHPSSRGAESESLESVRRRYNLIGIGIGKSTGTNEWYESAGLRKKGYDDCMTIDDLVPVLSMTKAMTATLLMLLVKDGLFTWDSTLAHLLPDFTNLHTSHLDLDLKHLTAHRSGITETEGINFGHMRSWQNPTLSATEGRRCVVEDILSRPAGSSRGTFKYNNVNYLILGLIIDRIAGGSWETIIMDRLFKPLGMHSVVFGQSPETGPVPIGHWPNPLPFLKPFPVSSGFQRFTAMLPAVNPAGGVRCTMQDYMKFIRLHMEGVHGSGVLGLTVADFRFLHTPFSTVDVQDEMERYTYGGWVRPFDEDRGGTDYCLWHPGGFWYLTFRGYIEVEARTCYTAVTNMALPNANKALDDVIAIMKSGNLSWQEESSSRL